MAQITYALGMNQKTEDYNGLIKDEETGEYREMTPKEKEDSQFQDRKCSIDELLEMIEQEYIQKFGLYEIFGYEKNSKNYNQLFTEFVRPYFDYDLTKITYNPQGKQTGDNTKEYDKIMKDKSILLSQLKKWICEKLGKDDCKFAISAAHNKIKGCEKISYHIVVYNYKVRYLDMIEFKKKYKDEMNKIHLDLQPYKAPQQKFRIIQTEKNEPPKHSPALIPINKSIPKEKHIISNVTDEPLLELNLNKIVPSKTVTKKVVKKTVTKTSAKKVTSNTEVEEDDEQIDEKGQDRIDAIVMASMYSKVPDAIFTEKTDSHGTIIYRFRYNNNNKCPACKGKHDKQGIYAYVKDNNVVMRGQSDQCMRGDKDATIEIGRVFPKFSMIPKEEVTRDDIIEGDVKLDDASIAEKIVELAGDKFITRGTDGDRNKEYYCFTGSIWEKGKRLLEKYVSHEIFEYYNKIIDNVYQGNERKKYKSQLEKKTRNFGGRKSIVNTYDNISNIEFDSKPHLFGLRDKVIDLRTYEIRDYRQDDYIIMQTGYNYRKATDEEKINVEKLLRSIFPIPEEYDMILQILSTGLDGRSPQKFILQNGSGGNGKGLLNRFMECILGSYYIEINSTILTRPLKSDGPNIEVYKIAKKRYVVAKEISSNQTLDTGTILKLTGGDSLTARTHHAEETNHQNCSTLVFECNKKPLFSGETNDDSMPRRLIDVPYRSTFTTDEDKLNDEKNSHANSNYRYVYPKNEEYDTQEWRNKHKYAFLEILLENHKNFGLNCYNFDKIIPKSIKALGREYLDESNDVKSFVNQYMEKTDNDDDYTKIKDIHERFIKHYKLYGNSLRVKTQKYIKSELEKLYGNLVRDQAKIKGVKVNGVLKGFRFLEDDENKPFPDNDTSDISSNDDDDSDCVEVLDPKNTLESKPSKILKTNLFKKTESVVKQTNTTVTKTIKRIPKELDKIPSMTIKI